MAKDIFGNEITTDMYGRPISKPKRKTLTLRQRVYIWERPKIYGRKCHICGQAITKLSDLELDHRRAYSKGGTTLALAHRECNRLKGNKGLGKIQKLLGLKKKTKSKPRAKTAKPSKPKQGYGILGSDPNVWVNPVTGKKEKFNPWGVQKGKVRFKNCILLVFLWVGQTRQKRGEDSICK